MTQHPSAIRKAENQSINLTFNVHDRRFGNLWNREWDSLPRGEYALIAPTSSASGHASKHCAVSTLNGGPSINGAAVLRWCGDRSILAGALFSI
jgi:hypothetical protein